MKSKQIYLFALLLMCHVATYAQKAKIYQVQSPDGAIVVNIEAGAKLQWSVQHKGQQIIAPSPISLTLQSGEVLGDNAKITPKTESVNTTFNTINFVKSVINDIYNQITLNCKGNYGVIFRVYDDAVAYRFFTKMPGEIIIKNEEANFNFTDDHNAYIPMQWDYRGGHIFNSSFENTYKEIKLSQFPEDSLAFLPVLVDAGQNKKAELFEVDLEDYPGMYVDLNQTGKGFKGVFAPYPLEIEAGGYNTLNLIPTKRAGYIAKTNGTRNFPWRAVVISEHDKDLLSSYIVQKLASPSRITDLSWIKAGQVAWDWWNAMNISGVDFKAGKNTDSYKYFIDFAAKYKVPYILLDGGWNERGDLTKPIANINLEELIAYGNQKGVGLIVWCSWKDIMSQKETAIPFYGEVGIKGMKIDFIDRDDQLAVASTYDIAKLASQHHLLVDYHGVFKPTGLQRTYPNVVGYEGVYGLENFKWAPNFDAPRYCVTLPFIRNQAGPMDYTSGAMRNTNKANYRPINDMPMAQGTRVNQMAQFIVFEVPIQMLSDNPTVYLREHECTEFITKVPTTFDETVPLDGKVAEYVTIARRKGNEWFVGAMTNWTPRELTIDLSFLGCGEYKAEIFKDGINANRDATDYKKELITVKSSDKLNVKLMNGGGWVARISVQEP
jgi:alpha-glucosidase